MKHVLIGKTQNTLHQFVRYLFVGGFAAVIDMGTLFALSIFVGVNYLIAAAIGFVVGLFANYLISASWVFDTAQKSKEEFALFSLIGAGGLGLTELIMWVGVDVAQLPLLFAKIVSLALVLIWNFGLRKKLVFERPVQTSSI